VDYSLSQFWALFYKCNEPDVYAFDTLNGVDLKSTLRIGADSYICTMGLCDKLLGIMSTVLFTDEQYTPIWSLPYFGIYSVKTFYEVVNYLLFLIILWLLFHNKLFTRENMAICQPVADSTSLFCSELKV
jgi:hypothetical protein